MQGNTDAVAAFEVAAILDGYEDQLLALRGVDLLPEGVGALQKALRCISDRCLRLPQLAVPSVALLLAHHRLLAGLARAGEHGEPADVAAAMRDVQQCLHALRRACRELFRAPCLH